MVLLMAIIKAGDGWEEFRTIAQLSQADNTSAGLIRGCAYFLYQNL